MARRKYYRNLGEISGIDAGALWYRNVNKMILVDDDQFIEVDHDETKFKQERRPE